MLTTSQAQAGRGFGSVGTVAPTACPEIVIVDPDFRHHTDLVRAAEAGRIRLHVCVNGLAAIRLAMRHQADAWFVAAELDDVGGIDLASMLVSRPGGDGRRRHGVYLVAQQYRLEEEQDALAAGVTGYLVDSAVVRLAVESHRGRPTDLGSDSVQASAQSVWPDACLSDVS